MVGTIGVCVWRSLTLASLAQGHILKGALTYKDRKVVEVMTPLSTTYKLPITALIDKKTVLEMLELGHTRIPVFDGKQDNIVAILYAKDLVGLGHEKKTPLKKIVKSFDATKRVVTVSEKADLGVAFDTCKEKRIHMLIVADGKKASGVITTEDILEEILQFEIVGDDDKFVDNATERKLSGGQGVATSSRRGVQKENSMRYDPTALVRENSGVV